MAGGIMRFLAAEYIPGQLESHVLRRLAGSYINVARQKRDNCRT